MFALNGLFNHHSAPITLTCQSSLAIYYSNNMKKKVVTNQMPMLWTDKFWSWQQYFKNFVNTFLALREQPGQARPVPRREVMVVFGMHLLNGCVHFLFPLYFSISATIVCQNPSSKGADYQGQASTTKSGLQCQPWVSDTPHKPSASIWQLRFRLITEANFCRNPAPKLRKQVWCYTMDPTKRWEYCDVPHCETGPGR